MAGVAAAKNSVTASGNFWLLKIFFIIDDAGVGVPLRFAF